MRSVEFVGRTGQKIAVQELDIDGAVRREVDGVDKCQRADFFGRGDDPGEHR